MVHVRRYIKEVSAGFMVHYWDAYPSMNNEPATNFIDVMSVAQKDGSTDENTIMFDTVLGTIFIYL